jgi:hypothetical protein
VFVVGGTEHLDEADVCDGINEFARSPSGTLGVMLMMSTAAQSNANRPAPIVLSRQMLVLADPRIRLVARIIDDRHGLVPLLFQRHVLKA